MNNFLQLKYINAVRTGDLPQMKNLLQRGVEIDCFNNGALIEAVHYGHLDIVVFLVESKIDINKNNGLELVLAFNHKRINIAQYLLRKDIVENFKALTTELPKEEKPLESMTEYLIEQGNYIKYAACKNDKSIIEWSENYIRKQNIFNAFQNLREQEKDTSIINNKLR